MAATCAPAGAHPVPFSYIDVRVEPDAVELTIVVHTFDVANDLKIQPPETVLERDTLERAGTCDREADSASSDGLRPTA